MADHREMNGVRVRIKRFGMTNESDRSLRWFFKKHRSFEEQFEAIRSGRVTPLDVHRQPISLESAITFLAARAGVASLPTAPGGQLAPSPSGTSTGHLAWEGAIPPADSLPRSPQTGSDLSDASALISSQDLSSYAAFVKRRVFISHYDEDYELVEAIHGAIIEAGHEAWWGEDILGGDHPDMAMAGAMAWSDSVVLILSARGLDRIPSEGQPELYRALELDQEQPGPEPRRLIPVRLDDCTVPSISLRDGRRLEDLATVDLFPNANWNRGIRRLLKSLVRGGSTGRGASAGT